MTATDSLGRCYIMHMNHNTYGMSSLVNFANKTAHACADECQAREACGSFVMQYPADDTPGLRVGGRSGRYKGQKTVAALTGPCKLYGKKPRQVFEEDKVVFKRLHCKLCDTTKAEKGKRTK